MRCGDFIFILYMFIYFLFFVFVFVLFYFLSLAQYLFSILGTTVRAYPAWHNVQSI